MDLNIKDQQYILFTSGNFPTGGAGATYLNLFCKGMILHERLIKVYMIKGYAFGENSERTMRKNKTSYGVSYTFLGLTKRPQNGFLKLIDDFLSFFHLLFLLPLITWKRKRVTIFVYQTDFFHSLMIYLTAYLFKIRIISFVPEFFNKVYYTGFIKKLQWFGFIFTFDRLNTLSDGLIVFSQYLRDIYLKKGVKEDRIFVQPNLTDFEFWNVHGNKEKYTVGYSGTPGGKDGLGYLFKAVSLLKNQMPISLVVVGDSPFGKSKIPELEIVCENLGIRNQVHFAGLVEYNQVKTYLSECKLLAITRPRNIQTQAGFPTKLGEYMALKKPVLATNFGEMEAYFTDGNEIVLAECDNPESIADKIRWMLRNEELIKIIAVNGYKKAHTLLEYKKSITKIINYLDEI